MPTQPALNPLIQLRLHITFFQPPPLLRKHNPRPHEQTPITPSIVHASHTRIPHQAFGMLKQRVLDFRSRNLQAFNFDHLLQTIKIDDPIKPIPRDQVSRPQPAHLRENLSRRFLILEIPRRNHLASCPQLALLSFPHVLERIRVDNSALHAGKEIPDTPRQRRLQAENARCSRRRDGRGFTQPVAAWDRHGFALRQLLGKLVRYIWGQIGSA